MNLLITGGAGFIGSNLIRLLIQRPEVHKIINLDCLTYAGHLENLAGLEAEPRYIFAKADLRDQAAVRKVFREHAVTHVIHLAAETHVDRSISAPAEFIHTNILGTFHLIEACREFWQSGPELQTNRRLLHVSTDEVYGSLSSGAVFSENSGYAPNSPYAASKAASDMLVRAAHRTYGLPAVISNCSNNYGPFQFPEKLIPVVIQGALAKSQIPIYGDGLNIRDWLHVSDHAEALWQLLNHGRDGETYCVGGDSERTNIEMACFICDTIDEIHPHDGRPSRDLISFVKDRPGHDRRYAIDHSKLTRETGWTPRHSLESGLRQTIQWYIEHQEWVRTVTQ